MLSTKQIIPLAVIFVQLLGMIHCRVYDGRNQWVNSDKSQLLPEGAVLGGFDPQGFYIYIGRVLYSNSALPARIVRETGRATYNTETFSTFSTSYQVLVANETSTYHWVRSFDGHVEKEAVCTGTSLNNDRLYVCRFNTDGGLLIGTLYTTEKACIVKYEDYAIRRTDKYEVLVRQDRSAATFDIAPFDMADLPVDSTIN